LKGRRIFEGIDFKFESIKINTQLTPLPPPVGGVLPSRGDF